jgi:hypothetical protein
VNDLEVEAGLRLLLSRYLSTVLLSWAGIIQASTKMNAGEPETVIPAGRLSWPLLTTIGVAGRLTFRVEVEPPPF